jgi:hypothetical protein
MAFFPPFALMQKVEPKDQGCPDAPPGSQPTHNSPAPLVASFTL